jgi:hypothetical protein
MKHLLISIFIILIFWGCQDTANITDPIHNANLIQLNKKSYRVDYSYNLIQLPAKSPEWQDSVFTVNKEINGEEGGNITLWKYYITENGWPLFIYATLDIPEGAFQGIQTITMTLDDEFATVHFFPDSQGKWDKPFILNQYFQGIDLIGLFDKYMNLRVEDMDFVYICENGEIEVVRKSGFSFNSQLGLIKVVDASLEHFSRYGWIRMHASGN